MAAFWGRHSLAAKQSIDEPSPEAANGLWCYFLSGAGMFLSAGALLSAVPVVDVFVVFLVSLHPIAAITAIRSVAANHFRIAGSPKRGKNKRPSSGRMP